MHPMGCQPSRLYGLANVHKTDIHVPWSAYHPIATLVTELNVVTKCQINTSSNKIADSWKLLREDEVVVYFDVVLL